MTKWKSGKIEGFSIPRSKSDKTWRISVDCGTTPACQIWRGSVYVCGCRSPKNFQHRSFLRGYVWLYIVVYAHHDEIWQRRVCYVPALTCQIWPKSGIGVGTVSLQR